MGAEAISEGISEEEVGLRPNGIYSPLEIFYRQNPNGKSAIDVFSDFLRYRRLHKSSRNYFVEMRVELSSGEAQRLARKSCSLIQMDGKVANRA